MIELPIQVKQDIDAINAVSKELKMKLYVVGGFPRDIVMGIGINDNTDIDVTEANGNAFDLAFFVAAKYNLPDPIVYQSSGTAMVKMPSGRTIEFHNAFYNVPHIIDQLYALGIEPSPLNKDVYSRDFTINTLLFDPDNGEILDVTNKGVDDIKNKILRTPLPARKSIQINPKIILRGIRFKIAFNLKEDDDYATEAVKFAPNLIQFLNDNKNSKFIQNNVNKAMEINPDKAIEEFRKYGILEYLPINDNIDKAIKKEMFGTTITPSSFPSMKVAQTKMMQRLMLEREKHKAYMRRKRREEKEKSMEKFKILDRARSGYYIENPEPEFIKNRKIDKNRKLFDYITEQDY